MPANSKCTRLIWFLIAVVSLNSCVSNNNKLITIKDLSGMWKVISLVNNEKEIQHHLLTNDVFFKPSNQVFMPSLRPYEITNLDFCPFKLIKGNSIYIEDCRQGVLSGEYKMQLSRVKNIKTLLLRKEDITIELQDVGGNLDTGMPTNFGKR